MKYDVIVIGAGVSGLLSAIELAESGASCCILEQGLVGKESSWAGGGILSPLYPWQYPKAVNDLAAWSWQHYPDFLAQLKEQTGIDPEWISSGHLILDPDDHVQAAKHWANTYDVQIEEVTTQALQKLEPAITEHFSRALWLPKIGQVRNPRLIQALHQRALQLGIEIREHTVAKDLILSGQRVTGVRTATDTILSHNILITTGAWSGLSLNQAIQLPPITPVKGQMIQFQTPPGMIQRISLHRGHYVIPRQDGKVLAGSTLEHTGFDKSTDTQAADKLRAAAAEIYPALKSAPMINHWAGLRPGNNRQTPYICEHPEVASLFFNTGHFRNGIILGLASTRLCADLILQRQPGFPAEAYGFT